MKDGFLYIGALTQAIEAWSRDVLRSDPFALRYRGADLRHAVERQLYFFLLNCDETRALFVARTSGQSDPSMKSAHAYARMIAPYIAIENAGQAGAVPHLADRVRLPGWKRAFSRSLRGVLRWASRARQKLQRPDSPEILFLVIHPKFVGFLDPVVQRVQQRAAFLTLDDTTTEAHIRNAGLPGLHLSSQRGGVAPSGVLGAFSGLCDQYDLCCRLMASEGLRVVVVPEGNAPVYEIVRAASAATRVSVVCIQQGWSPIAHSGFRNLCFDNMLVWGSLFAQMLAPFNPKQRFTATGIPVPLALPRDRSLDSPILSVGFFLQKGGPAIDDEDWLDFLRLIGWVAATYPSINVIVRDHPATSTLSTSDRALIGEHQNIAFMNPSSHPLNEVLGACDVVLAAYSTTLLEAVAVGAIPVIYGASGMERYWPDLAGAGAGIQASSLKEVKSHLTRLIDDRESRATVRAKGRDMRSHLFAASGASAVDGIVREIEATALQKILV